MFQFHPIHTNASPVVPYYPRLELSIADLFHPHTIDHPTFVNALTEPQVIVTNALLRIAHGGWDVSTVLISENHNVIQTNDMSGFKDKRTKDYWVEEGNQVIRVHNKPRSNLFIPKESSHPTIQEYMLKDERRTLRVNVRDEDDWKERKDNWRTGENRIPFKGPKWTGRTIFTRRTRKQYLSAPSTSMYNLRTIPLREMFFVGHISTAISEGRGVRSVTLIIERKNGIGSKEYRFESNDEDFQLMGLVDKQAKEGEERGIVVMMQEIPDSVPRIVLLCSEEMNWFTVMNTKRQEKYGRREGTGSINLLVVTITVHDDLNSDYGFHKASLSLRDEKDTMFFAGPCTGGSSWARLNRSKGPETEAIIEAKVEIFKQLWGRFEELFISYYGSQIGIYMELPRGCEYWNNDEVRFMIEGTDSSIHDFDGCCYGLRQKFGDSNK